jgi:hypothetical protein
VAKLPQAGEVFEQLKVLRGGFPEANARVHQDALIRDASNLSEMDGI